MSGDNKFTEEANTAGSCEGEATPAPRTVRQALDELAEMGFADEVAAVRQRMHDQTASFVRLMLGK